MQSQPGEFGRSKGRLQGASTQVCAAGSFLSLQHKLSVSRISRSPDLPSSQCLRADPGPLKQNRTETRVTNFEISARPVISLAVSPRAEAGTLRLRTQRGARHRRKITITEVVPGDHRLEMGRVARAIAPSLPEGHGRRWPTKQTGTFRALTQNARFLLLAGE